MKPPVQYAMMPPRVDAPKVGKMKPVQQPKVAKMRGIDEALDYYLGPTGIPDRLAAVNQMFNPVETLGGSMRASQRLFAPETDGWGRVQAAGDMLSGIAGFVAPMVAAAKVGAGVVDAFAGINASPQQTLASKREKLYNLPTNSEVGYAGSEMGRLYPGGLDIEGRPLVARHVVGGTADRTVQQSLPSEAVAEIIQGFTGQEIERVSRLGAGGRGDVGSLVLNRFTGQPLRVEVLDKLPKDAFENVTRHEGGHLIDEVAGKIPTKGLNGELEALYQYGVEGKFRGRNRTLPRHLGYSAEEVPREYMAEAIRQYGLAPDTMKEMFPRTAETIRKYVNVHPELRQWVQFNSLAGAAVGGAAMSQPQQGIQLGQSPGL